MPNKNNAKKALRQAKKRAAQNREKRIKFREAVKTAAQTANKKDALAAAKTAQQALDKAAKTGVIKKNTAARRLSRLMKKINQKTT